MTELDCSTRPDEYRHPSHVRCRRSHVSLALLDIKSCIRDCRFSLRVSYFYSLVLQSAQNLCYRVASGVFVSMLAAPLIPMGETHDVGLRLGMFFTILAFGALAGPPVSGAINQSTNGFKAVGYYAGRLRSRFHGAALIDYMLFCRLRCHGLRSASYHCATAIATSSLGQSMRDLQRRYTHAREVCLQTLTIITHSVRCGILLTWSIIQSHSYS